MKRIPALLLSVLLLLAGCASGYMVDGVYEYTRVKTADSSTKHVHVLDRSAGAEYDLFFTGGDTVTRGGEAYTYHYNAQGRDNYSVSIRYPDGETVSWQFTGTGGSGSGSLFLDSSYLDDDLLIGAVRFVEGAGSGGIDLGGLLLALLLTGLGLLALLAPEAAWWLHSGWRYKNAEPSSLALGVERVGGAVMIIIGFFLLFGGQLS